MTLLTASAAALMNIILVNGRENINKFKNKEVIKKYYHHLLFSLEYFVFRLLQ